MRRTNTARLTASLLLVALSLNGCALFDSRDHQTIPDVEGTWGGDGIRLDARKTGWAFLFDCGQGGIAPAAVLDEQGRFEARGWYTLTAGIQRQEPAQYTGEATESAMVLVVTLPDRAEALGTFTLNRGDPGEVVNCR